MGGLTGPAAAETRLRLIWWGNPDRDRAHLTRWSTSTSRRAADVTIDPETYAWNDYWPKLATQAAGQNLPDVIQMDYRYIFEYARRGQLADLTPFVGKQIDLADFDPNQLESGKVDGKLYGISLGANSMTHVYKPALLEELGLTLPDPTKWTIDDYRRHGQGGEGQAAGGHVLLARTWPIASRALRPGCASAARRSTRPTASSATTSRTSTDYFAFWFQMQEDGLTPPADLQAQAVANGKMEETMFVTGHALFDFIHSNQLVADAEAGARRAQHHHDPQPDGRTAGPVSEALDADLDGRDLGRSRTPRRS